MNDKTPDILIPALRQYQHNDCSGLLAGFDYDETVKIVTNLQQQILDICQPQWIPVSDTLPISGDRVQWGKSGRDSIFGVYKYDTGDDGIYDDNDDYYPIDWFTHWKSDSQPIFTGNE